MHVRPWRPFKVFQSIVQKKNNMQFHEIVKTYKSKKTKRVGRGGKRGTYSGKGLKGQKSRAGKKIRPEVRDMIKKLHKKRGYGVHRSDTVRSDKPDFANLSTLEKISNTGEKITPKFLVEKGIISKREERRTSIKILGGGAITKKLNISGCKISESARKAIEVQGGTIKI